MINRTIRHHRMICHTTPANTIPIITPEVVVRIRTTVAQMAVAVAATIDFPNITNGSIF